MRRTPSYAKRSESLRKRCESVRKKSPELKAGRINRSGARSTLREPAAKIDECAKLPENPASKSSHVSSRRFKSPRAWAFKGESSPMGMRIGDCFPESFKRKRHCG
jgi:hypothetical protein